MNTILTITNGTQSINIESTTKIRTRVSEECFIRMKNRSSIDVNEIVLHVLLEEAKIDPDERINWSLMT
jgi:hypothetical protein